MSDPAAVCPFHESEYSIADAEALAALWGVDLAEAKARVERKLVWGDRHVIKEYLDEARGPVDDPGRIVAGDDAAFRDLFWDSKYTACDAEVMARHWEMDVMDAKAFAGQKIAAGNRSVVEDRLRAARTQEAGAAATARPVADSARAPGRRQQLARFSRRTVVRGVHLFPALPGQSAGR